MKWEPFNADSVNKMPLFPIIPTGCPHILAKPVTNVCINLKQNKLSCTTHKIQNANIVSSTKKEILTVPYNFLNSSNSLPSTIRAITERMSKDCFKSDGAIERSSSISYNGSW